MLIQPFSELGATNEGQRVDAGQRFARRSGLKKTVSSLAQVVFKTGVALFISVRRRSPSFDQYT